MKYNRILCTEAHNEGYITRRATILAGDGSRAEISPARILSGFRNHPNCVHWRLIYEYAPMSPIVARRVRLPYAYILPYAKKKIRIQIIVLAQWHVHFPVYLSFENHFFTRTKEVNAKHLIVHCVTRGRSVCFYGEGNVFRTSFENTSQTVEMISPESHTILFLTSPMISVFFVPVPVGRFRNYVFRSCRAEGKH